MAYTLNYTGQEVDNVVGRFADSENDSFIEERKLLWTNPNSITPTTQFENQEIIISNLSNYNAVEIEFYANYIDHLADGVLIKIIKLPVVANSQTDIQCSRRTPSGNQSYLKRAVEIETNAIYFTDCYEYEYTTTAFNYANWYLIPTKIYGIKHI